LRQVENRAIRVRTTISRTRYRAPLAMISLSHLDAFQALCFLDVEAHSSTLSLHISGELLKKIPALTIPCFINKSLMFSAPPFHCGDFECSGGLLSNKQGKSPFASPFASPQGDAKWLGACGLRLARLSISTRAKHRVGLERPHLLALPRGQSDRGVAPAQQDCGAGAG
jgi:hypothetical protein